MRLPWGDESFLSPSVRVTFEGFDIFFPATVDTGAGITVVHRDVLTQLGYSNEDIEAGEEVSLAGIGGVVSGHLHELTLVFGYERSLTLPAVPCVVTDAIDDDIVLGQFKALERLFFVQSGPVGIGSIADRDSGR